MAEKKEQSMFESLYNLDCSKFIEKKKSAGDNELSYLAWAYAWAHFKKAYPDATYEIVKNERHLPYFSDPETGIIVYTRVTAGGETHEMWLPVMDGANKAMKRESYVYEVWDKEARKYVEKGVAAATMFDINKTIMRCLVKNLAIFGLGLSIYAGEDIPVPLTDEEEKGVIEEVKKRERRKTQGNAQVSQDGRKTGVTSQGEAGKAALQKLTMQMYEEGRLQTLVDYLADYYDANTDSINPGAVKSVTDMYDCEPGVVEAMKQAAGNKAFKNDLHNKN